MWGLLFIHDIKISKALFYATLNFSSICCYQIFKSWSSIHSIVLFFFFINLTISQQSIISYYWYD